MCPQKIIAMTPLFSNFFPEGIITFISDRSQDFTLPQGENDLREEQKKILSQQFDFILPKVFTIRQVHGKKIIVLKNNFFKPLFKKDIEEADGIITNVDNLPIAVRTADCLSIFLYNSKKHCIGLVHAGWRGSQKGIIFEALKFLRVNFESEPQDLKVAFGPCIRSCCYRVGEEFKKYFPKDTILKGNAFYLDLVKMNTNEFVRFGVKPENIFDCGICTCCSEQYFSYRREGEKAGRMISLMMLKKD